MNYAWANPSTGIREQANTKEEARLQAWEAGHRKDLAASVKVYEQESAGWVSKTAFDVVIAEPWESYAWTSPTSGERRTEENFFDAVERIQAFWPEHAPVDTVTVYRQRLAFTVDWNDPKPELPGPAPVEIPPDTPQSLIQQVLDGTCPDVQRAQVLAMLWIAESSMEIAGALHYMSPGPRGKRWTLWGAIKAFWQGCHQSILARSSVQPPAAGAPMCPPRSGGTSPNKNSFPEYSELPPETEDQANKRRVKAIKERNKIPTYVHKFEPKAPHSGYCLLCGSSKMDDIHQG